MQRWHTSESTCKYVQNRRRSWHLPQSIAELRVGPVPLRDQAPMAQSLLSATTSKPIRTRRWYRHRLARVPGRRRQRHNQGMVEVAQRWDALYPSPPTTPPAPPPATAA